MRTSWAAAPRRARAARPRLLALLVVLVAVLGSALLAGCSAREVQRQGGDAEPVGLAPIASVIRDAASGPLWAVALAVSDQGPNDARLRPPVPSGFEAKVLDVDCDDGAREGLQLRPRAYWYTAVYFPSQEMGFRFKDRYGLSVVGIVAVQPTPGCT